MDDDFVEEFGQNVNVVINQALGSRVLSGGKHQVLVGAKTAIGKFCRLVFAVIGHVLVCAMGRNINLEPICG